MNIHSIHLKNECNGELTGGEQDQHLGMLANQSQQCEAPLPASPLLHGEESCFGGTVSALFRLPGVRSTSLVQALEIKIMLIYGWWIDYLLLLYAACRSFFCTWLLYI